MVSPGQFKENFRPRFKKEVMEGTTCENEGNSGDEGADLPATAAHLPTGVQQLAQQKDQNAGDNVPGCTAH